MELFSINSRFYQFMCKTADCMLLSILWIVFSLPVFTFGAATASLYYCVLKVVKNEQGNAIKTFWHAFKSNFRQGTIITIITFLIYFAVIYTGTQIYHKNSNDATLNNIYLTYLILSVFGTSWLHYLLTYIGKFSTSLPNAIKNSLIICIANFPFSISMTVLFAVVIMLMVRLFPASFATLLFLPAVYMLITSYILERVYKKYANKVS